MSSSFIVEPKDKSKKDDTLIIVVNDDGTISVDHETLQNIIINQSNANVSVVRLGQGDAADTENGDITLTVDPPPYLPPETNSSTTTSGSADAGVGGLVDPFMEMDPEQLERLETALQSEEAKQILGENVTAMLDMLSVEEEQNSLKYSIQLDHCYTSRKSPSDPKPSDPLPIAESPEINDALYSSTPSSSLTTNVPSVSSPNLGTGTAALTTSGKSKLFKTGRGPGRPRKDGRPPGSAISTPKTTGHILPRNVINVLQQGVNKGALVPLIKPLNMNDVRINASSSLEGIGVEASQSSSSESSESEPPSDDDSDFGPRGPRRSGVRARGGRKGLTTRGGSLTATRRRGSNKHMDMEQVRRLDMEMAAAVDAMKSPEKEEKSAENRLSPTKAKKSLKTLVAKKKEEPAAQPAAEAPNSEAEATASEKQLITTNQVKANLINANTIKGDMILTKPGQMRNNQKVIFVQKQVMMKASELKNLGIKKPVVVSKPSVQVGQVNSKVAVVKEPKIQQNIVPKVITQPVQAPQMPPSVQNKVFTQTPQAPVIVQPLAQIQQQPQSQPSPQQPAKATAVPTPVTPVKAKTPEAKKEKKKLEIISDVTTKVEVEPVRPPEPKTPDGTKKHQKREHRKSPSHLAVALGPALFSTPDIIRRVGSGNEPKTPEAVATSPTKTAPPLATSSSPVAVTPTTTTTASIPEEKISSDDFEVDSMQPHLRLELGVRNHAETEGLGETEHEDEKIENKAPLAEELQASLDAVSHAAPTTEVANASVDQHLVPETNVSESSGIEGEEHLLATLASKHEEELLAEALLLQEELGVDLADHPSLEDQAAAVSEALLPASSFAPLTEIPENIEQPVLSPVRSVPPSPAIVSESIKKSPKEEKEPVQIVRGGRIITLPPIEAPATRSKRLQAKGDTPHRTIEVGKPEKKIKFAVQQQEIPIKDEMESEMDEDDDEGDNSDSEDDPDRLWCICKRPHNNRFMICCDVCEDWFHGKCVHVSKAMGQQMEEKGIEWVCPNCLKKKSDDSKESLPSPGEIPKLGKTSSELMSPSVHSAQRISSPVHTVLAPSSRSPVAAASNSSPIITSSLIVPGVTQCVVCKKEARNSSIYCSDACILTHAQESLTKDKPTPTPAPSQPQQRQSKGAAQEPQARSKPDARVIVFERKSGKVLTGTDAPTTSNLKTWLKENPTYEVVRPNNLNTLQIGGKTVTAISTPGPGKVTKTIQQISAKGPQGQPKMVYAKVAGSKQTVLAPSNKKLLIVSSAQSPAASYSSPQGKLQLVQSRQTLLTTTVKNPTFSPKQSVITTPRQQQKIQLATAPLTSAMPKQNQASKKVESRPSTSQQTKIQLKSTSKRPETEPIRLNIRKTLAELLSSRIKETEDLKLSEDEITELALKIELEMYKFFRDTGAKYKAKYRSLVFNIKDTKNLTLFRKIADRSLAPDAVVRLSPEEMASQELAEWREKETKHQLEMIKKNELDLMAQAKSIVVKTHKGEQIIENDGGIDHVDPKTPVQDIVTALNSGDSISSSTAEEEKKDKGKHDGKKQVAGVHHGDKKKEKEKEKEKEKHDRSRSRSRRHHSRDSDSRSKTRERSRERERRSTRSKESKREKDREREREKEKEREREREREREKEKQKEKDKHKKSRTSSTRNRSRGRHRDYGSKEAPKKEEDRKKEVSSEVKKESSSPLPTDKPIPIEDRLWRHIEDETTTTNTLDGNESDVSDREPSSTVTIKTPDFNEEFEKEKEEQEQEAEEEEEEKEKQPAEVEPSEAPKGSNLQTVWRGFVNMVDVAKFFITAQEVSGQARDLMDDLPDTVDVVGRISHETVWDYISKMKRTGSKEILIIRLTAANDEEKIPYITLYSYLNSRSRLGVVGNVSANIKDFYIMPFSSQSVIPSVLLPLDGPGFEEHRPHLLLGIIVRNKRKRPLTMPSTIPSKMAKKEAENRSYTPPLMENTGTKDVSTPPSSPTSLIAHSKPVLSSSGSLEALLRAEKQKNVTQMTLESLNKAHVGMSRAAIIENAKMSKIVPELSMKIGSALNSPVHHAKTVSQNDLLLLQDDDDGDEPYSPGGMDNDEESVGDQLVKGQSSVLLLDHITNISLPPTKNSTELQRKMDELNRQIEEQKQQIQNISSSFLGDATATLPGLGLDPPGINDSEEAYSPTDTRSFTPPPQGIQKISQPILDKVSNITIPANLQEILANVKRQESSKVDPYLPSKPSASFLTSVNSSAYQKPLEKYPTSAIYGKTPIPNVMALGSQEKNIFDNSPQPAATSVKENKSTLRSLSDLDLIKKAEEELAAVAGAASASSSPSVAKNIPLSFPTADNFPETKNIGNAEAVTKKILTFDQPKPPGLEDEEFSLTFPVATPTSTSMDNLGIKKNSQSSKFVAKSGVVLSVKRKLGEESSSSSSSSNSSNSSTSSPCKTQRTKSRWGQGPSDKSQ